MKITTYCIAVGIGLLLNSSLSNAQSGNYFSGTSAGASNTTGDYNAFAGYGAGTSNTSGSLNTAFGFYAGGVNKATSYNTSIGAYAGYFTASSFGENVFVGYSSGFSNSNGFYNVFLGSHSGYTNNTGSYNVFIGASAGYDNTSGLSNTFIGYVAGTNNTTASANTFVGNLSGFSNTTGANNSFYGSGSATSNTTGANNAIFGSGAGYYNNASNNTFMGYYAGRNNTTGNLNVFVGTSSGAGNTGGVNNTFVGGQAGLANTSGRSNSFFGIRAGEKNTTGIDNTFIGRETGRNVTTGSGNTAIGNYAQQASSSQTNSTAIGNKSIVRTSNAMVLGSINGENGSTVTVRVGIGTASPGYTLHVNGTAAKPGGGSWTVASDKRLKKDIEPFKGGLKELTTINPVWFRYNGKANLPTEKRFVGVIAQEMQKIAPHSVGEFEYHNPEGGVEKYLHYDASDLPYVLVNAVKELNTLTEKLTVLAQEQSVQIKKLEAEIEALKRGKPLESSGGNEARLWQNFPNPAASTTVIRYYLPETVGTASIRVFSVTGQEVYSRDLMERGESEIEISNQMLSVGSYVYELIVDGKVVSNKRMVISK